MTWSRRRVSGQRWGGRLIAVAAVAVAALMALVIPGLAANGSGDGAIRPDAEAVLGPLGMSIANAPNPVLGADGRHHLAYEITIVNQSPATVAIDQVQPRAGGTPFGPPLEGAALEALLRVNGGDGPAIPGGGSALLFMDVTYDKGVAAPRLLTHGFTITLRSPTQPDQTIEFIGVPTRVGQGRAIEVAPPLRGPGWVAAEGCCSPINSHRGATLSIDGTVRVPERFAIDFVQLNADDRLFTGPIDQLSSYAYFGAPIHSVAAGTVVGLQDGRPEQTPGALPTGATIQTAGGNYVVVRIAKGRFAFYAHMQPGSLRVGIAIASGRARCSGCSATRATRTRRTCTSTSWTAPRRSSPTGSPSSSRASRARGASRTWRRSWPARSRRSTVRTWPAPPGAACRSVPGGRLRP